MAANQVRRFFSRTNNLVGNPTGAPFWWNLAGPYTGPGNAGPAAIWFANIEVDNSEEIWVAEVVDAQWEIRRLHRFKSQIVNSKKLSPRSPSRHQ
jgi:hypothetical protein